MKLLKNKKITTMLAMLLMLSFVVSMVAVPNANAQDRMTFPFVDALPNPAGVGQPVLINWGLVNIPGFTDRDGWNVTLQIIDPNGKIENTTAKTWSTGTVGQKKSFMTPGNYTLRAFFDGEYFGTGNNRRWYLPSATENYTLQILENYWKPEHPGHTLPNEYWSRPVDSQLREWYTLMGSWFNQKDRRSNLYAPWNDAPTTAHILWSQPDDQYMGGMAGGNLGPVSFQHGDAYEGKFYGACIIGGVLYYNIAPVYSSGANAMNQTVRAIDLHTGQELWRRDLTSFGTTARLTRGQLMMFFSHNNRGAWGYLWIQNGNNGATWWALDALTGAHMFTLTDVPNPNGGGLSATTQVYQGPSGEMLIYVNRNIGTTSAPNWVMSQWNSTRAILGTNSLGTSAAWGSVVNTAGTPNTYNGTRGYDFDIPIERNRPWYGSGSINAPVAVFPMDRAIFANESIRGITLSAVSLDEDNRGQWLYKDRTWTAPKDWEAITLPETNGQSGWACFSNDPYIGVFWVKENRVNYVFSLETGRFLWETEPQIFANSWGGTTSNSAPEKVIVEGKLIECGGGGIVYCYNATTGTLMWTFEQTDKYTESYHREAWWAVPCFISSGKIYIGYSVHSSQVPLPRGAPFYALDIETGEVVWQIDGAFRQLAWGGRAVIGDSIIATIDSYDNQVYAVGKGPSEMTVTTSNAVTTAGNTVLISGTVMDTSPGTEQHEISKRFAKGVPAVADECMSDWMLYVYKNFERPMGTTGVEVTVFAQQGDHVIDVGKVVSDDSGRFAITWTPPADATGNWDVYAYFSGSGAYYGSWDKSEMAVLAAPEVVPPEPLPPYGWYIAGAAAAIIAAVAIVGILLFRKISK